jgi:endonuclease V-like protein UPF0215 family
MNKSFLENTVKKVVEKEIKLINLQHIIFGIFDAIDFQILKEELEKEKKFIIASNNFILRSKQIK